MSNLSVLTDAPQPFGRDSLLFDRYLTPLVSILTNPHVDQTPFTIGIFGAWGSGKSTLLGMLRDRLNRDHPDEFVIVEFNPWVFRRDPNLLIPLLNQLHRKLTESATAGVKASAAKIGNVLLRLGADILLKKATADLVSLEKLEKLEEIYLKKQQVADSEMMNLRETLRQQAEEVHASGAKLLFLIDDLDRCHPDDAIQLLESIKLFLDVPHSFVVLAMDKELIDKAIELKYDKSSITDARKLEIGAEYLEKMIQLPFQLYPLDSNQIKLYIENLGPSPLAQKYLPLILEVAVPNPRKIKRLLNSLTVIENIMEHSRPPEPWDEDAIVRLAALAVQNGDIFNAAARLPLLLKGLAGIYNTVPKYRRSVLTDFTADFGIHADTVFKLCTTYYRPETYLTPLFAGSTFFEMKAEGLRRHISILGS